MSPEISVVMAVKNGINSLEKSIKSVLSQTFSNFEFLIVDDYSTDNSFELLNSIKDKRIKIFKNEKNLGLTKSLNKIIDQAQGNFIARIDSDDFFFSEKLEKQILFFNENKRIGMCASCCEIISDSGNSLYSLCPNGNEKSLKWNLIFKNNIRHSTVVWRKELNKKYNEKFKQSQDYELWCRIIRENIEIGILNEVTAQITQRQNSITNRYFTSQETSACIVTQEQLKYYFKKRISFRESKNLRLMCFQRSKLQATLFNKLALDEIKTSVCLYLDLANIFYEKEKISAEDLIREINLDLKSLLASEHQSAILIEIFKWFENKEKNEFIELVEQNFIKVKKQEKWTKIIKFI